MTENATVLTAKQQAGLLALLNSASIEAAAKKIKVDKSTFYRWLKEPAFQVEFKEAKLQIFSDAITSLQKASVKAVNVLVEQFDTSDVPANVKVSAAKIILDFGFRGTEFEDVVDRLARLEKLLEERK